MKIYENLTLDEERALYGIHDAVVRACRFEGPADGESALKECGDVTVENCDFLLRYPLWHVNGGRMTSCRLGETCRAALWYDQDMTLLDCTLNGIKALRECDRMVLEHCQGESSEFGWFCRNLILRDMELVSEYPFLQCRDMEIQRLRMKGKYSFQYVKNVVIQDSVLDTKDAFWHSENVTVMDSVVKGEYLGWYSHGLKLIRCKITGTQPLCYAKNLVLEDCEMVDCDLSFENSEVMADIKGEILSVKNPAGGHITADHIGKVILDEHCCQDHPCVIRQKQP